MQKETWNGSWKRWGLLASFLVAFGPVTYGAKLQFHVYSMGTYWNVDIIEDSKTLIPELIEKKVIDIINLYDWTFSDWRKDSFLSKAEKNFNQWQKGTKLFNKGLNLALSLYQKSNGSFDITIGAVIWKKLSQPVGLHHLKLSSKGFRFSKNPQKLSFGALVKGMALGEIGNFFEKAGISQFRVNAGGGNLILKGPLWTEFSFYNFKKEDLIYFISRSRSHQHKKRHILNPKKLNQEKEISKAISICRSDTNRDLVEIGGISDALSTLKVLKIPSLEIISKSICWDFSKT